MSQPIGETPLPVDEVNARGVRLVARPGLEFPVQRDDDLLSVRIESLGIMVFGSTRQQLLDSLQAAIAEAWNEYMAAECPGDVSELRWQLISRFRPY